jgi:hypothetical protein
VAGFGLALLSLVWSDQAWRALSNDGTFMTIEGDLNFWRSCEARSIRLAILPNKVYFYSFSILRVRTYISL